MKCPSPKQLFSRETLAPYADVIIFMVTLLAANWLWKGTVTGDEYGDRVTWLGVDITAPFEYVTCHVAAAVYWAVSLVRDTAYMIGDHVIRFQSGTGTTVVWGCSGIKQSFIWLCLMLTVRGGWRHKLWYIPLGWLCCYVFNILRIALIAIMIEFHPSWFGLLHGFVFKYLFYGMLFGLWVIFVEKIRPTA